MSERHRFQYHYPADCDVPDPDPMVIYPNPTNGKIMIESEMMGSRDVYFLITNSLGFEIFNAKIIHLGDFVEIDLSIIPDGLYYIWLFQENSNKKQVGKVLKQ